LKSINVIRAREGVEELKEELRALGADEVVTDEEIARDEVREMLKSKVGQGGVKLGLNCVGGKQANDLCKLLRYDRSRGPEALILIIELFTIGVITEPEATW
jgi:trans-2-enoyl-CoA reductase